MTQLVNDLLRLSRVTRGGIERSRVDVTALASEVLAELADEDRDRNVDVLVEPAMSAYADARLLRVVLENLLGNAWKFTSRKPRARIEVGTVATAKGPTFVVRDDGAGFDPAFASALFAPFKRLHDPKEFEGTGVGLATVKRIVHRHGGRVWAESTLGEGAAFYFTLA